MAEELWNMIAALQDQQVLVSSPILKLMVCASNICTDSRKLHAGDVFVPLKGEHYDGHDFIEDAIHRGCIAYLYLQSKSRYFHKKEDAIAICVKDTMQAYLALAAYYRLRVISQVQIVAISGSYGKTTVRECALQWLSYFDQKHISASIANHNNEVGVAQTLLKTHPDVDVLLLEMGMRNIQDLEILVPVVQPNVSALTGVGLSHVGIAGSLANIYQGKMALYRQADSAVWVGPHDDANIANFVVQAKQENPHQQYVGFGKNPESNVRILQAERDILRNQSILKLRISTDVCCKEEQIISVVVSSAHHAAVMNTAIVCSIICALGWDITSLSQRVLEYPRIPGRYDQYMLGGVEMIYDAYNAAPCSMRQGLRSFRDQLKQRMLGGVVFLGDMLELGEQSAMLHQELGLWCARELGSVWPFCRIILIGEHMREDFYPSWTRHLENQKVRAVCYRFDCVEECLQSKWWSDWGQQNFCIKTQEKLSMLVYMKASYGMKFSMLISNLERYCLQA